MKIESSDFLLRKNKTKSIKDFGSYYTPDNIADVIALNSINTGNERILEPSAGGGSLIRAAHSRARAVSKSPNLSVLAFDVDETAIQTIKKIPHESIIALNDDFLVQEPKKFDPFDCVIANPPFNRNHSLNPEKRAELKQRFQVKGAIGIWAYFILHASNFLRDGGAIASVIPYSVTFTESGRRFLEKMALDFRQIGVYEFPGLAKWSNKADEFGALLLAKGYKQGRCIDVAQGYVNYDTGELETHEVRPLEQYDRLLKNTKLLGDMAHISIGAVTGKNSFFLISELERIKNKLSVSSLLPIVGKANHVASIYTTKSDLKNLALAGKKTWLFKPSRLTKNNRSYLSQISDEERKKVVWFNKRNPWWKVDVGEGCDAIFTYMNHIGPRITMVESGIVCTNTLHRLRFDKTTTEEDKYAIVLSPYSTFGQLAAEKCGRIYGGGVLKFEIKDARRYPIYTSPDTFNKYLSHKVDKLLRQGKLESATQIIDNAMLRPIFGEDWEKHCLILKNELARLRKKRSKE